MAEIDWIVLSGTLIFIVTYGVLKTRSSNSIKDHLNGGNSSETL